MGVIIERTLGRSSQARGEEVRTRCEEFFRVTGPAALSVSVRQGGNEVFGEAWGQADSRLGIPATVRTSFLSGSITKQFVAAAALMASADAGVSIDSPVVDLVPSLGGAIDARTTLRHLLSHTSGIRSGVEFELVGKRAASLSIHQVIDSLLREASQRPPASSWFYSNVGYFLVGKLVEGLSGVLLSEFIKERLLRPTMMSASGFIGEDPPHLQRAIGHRVHNGRFETISLPDPGDVFASGSLFASPQALTLWSDGLWISRTLGGSLPAIMSQNQELTSGELIGYGLGIYVNRFSEFKELSHDGHSAGFSSQLATYPDAQLAICVMTNSDRHVAERLEKAIACIFLNVPQTENPTAVAGESLERFVGTYLMGTAQVPVALYESGLMIKSPGGQIIALVPVGPERFAESDDPNTQYLFQLTGTARHLQIVRFGKHLASLAGEPLARPGNLVLDECS